MAFVIAEPCIGVKDTACVDACPVDCIHPKKDTAYEDGRPGYNEVEQLYIDPVECIDCSLCVDECPVSAIFDEPDLPPEYAHYVALNAELSKTWPLINDKCEPLADADQWSEVKEKFQHLETAETV